MFEYSDNFDNREIGKTKETICSFQELCQFPRKVGLLRILRAASVRVRVYDWAGLDTVSHQLQLLSGERKKDIPAYNIKLQLLTSHVGEQDASLA